MPRPVGVPVILVDGPSAGQLIHTPPEVHYWNVAKPSEAIYWTPSMDLSTVTIPAPTVYQIREVGMCLPTSDRAEPAYFRRRIGWSEGPEPDESAMRRHVRAVLLEHPDLMPPGARVWPADPADDQPIRILNQGDGPAPQCQDMFEMEPRTRLMRGRCPACGWLTEDVESRRFEELRALTAAHGQAGYATLMDLLERGVYSYGDYLALMGITDQANRRLVERPVGEVPNVAANRRADERVETWRPARTFTAMVGDDDWGEPLSASDANWPSDASRVCAHVCGGDADHACDARATATLTYALPSGGTRTMPICGPCHASENAAKEHADV